MIANLINKTTYYSFKNTMLFSSKYINTILLNNSRRSFMAKANGLMCSKTNEVANTITDNKQFIPIYKTSHMQLLIGLNKIKKYQTATLFCVIPSCFGLSTLGLISFQEVMCASLVGLGLTVGLHIASALISNNLVVFAYLSEDEKKCRLSYVSYWGNREELYCDIDDIEPIKYSKVQILNNKIKLNGSKIKYKIILRDATIFNNAKFRKVFGSDVM